MSIHKEAHELAGKTVVLHCLPDPDELNGKLYRIEDWWDRVAGCSWMSCQGNPACLKYALRSAREPLPTDNEVVYGKVDGLGHLVHVTELGGIAKENSDA